MMGDTLSQADLDALFGGLDLGTEKKSEENLDASAIIENPENREVTISEDEESLSQDQIDELLKQFQNG